MSQISVDLPDDLTSWQRERAAERRLTPAQMLELPVILESWGREVDPLGRRIPTRDFTYRQLTRPAEQELR